MFSVGSFMGVKSAEFSVDGGASWVTVKPLITGPDAVLPAFEVSIYEFSYPVTTNGTTYNINLRATDFADQVSYIYGNSQTPPSALSLSLNSLDATAADGKITRVVSGTVPPSTPPIPDVIRAVADNGVVATIGAQGANFAPPLASVTFRNMQCYLKGVGTFCSNAYGEFTATGSDGSFEFNVAFYGPEVVDMPFVISQVPFGVVAVSVIKTEAAVGVTTTCDHDIDTKLWCT